MHLWTIPSLPQINLHKRNERENVWSLTTSFVLHLCLGPSPLGAKCTFLPKFMMCARICYLVYDSVRMLGWCIFRDWVQEFRRQNVYIHISVRAGQRMCESCVLLPNSIYKYSSQKSVTLAKPKRACGIENINWFKMHTIKRVSIHRTHMHDSAAESFLCALCVCLVCPLSPLKTCL